MRDFARVKLRERKTLATKVFQRRTYQVELLVVDDEKTVVEGFVIAYGKLRVLGVEGLDVGIGNLAVGYVLLVVMLRCEDRHLHALALLREEVERFRRRPVVN